MTRKSNNSSDYSAFTWIVIIILIFVISFLFTKFFNNKKPIVRAEHWNPRLYKDGIHPYNWNAIQATVGSDFQDQMRSGLPGPVNAVGDPSVGCYKGYVNNLYDRRGDRCCVTADGKNFKDNCCNGTNRNGDCVQWDDFSTKVYRSPTHI